MLLVSSNLIFCQVAKDTLGTNSIYAPNNLNDFFSAEESWEIHKAAYTKQLKAKGLTEKEIQKSMIAFEKDKKEFIAKIKEQHKLAEIQRKKADDQRALVEIERKKADELRKQATTQRQKADELRKQAEIEREKLDELRVKDTSQRQKVDELRKQAEIERAKADEQRKIANIQRKKAEEERIKIEAKEKNTENILTKNIRLSDKATSIKPIVFNVISKTTLHIGIVAELGNGATLIEIYNPNGVKEAELYLEHKVGSGSINNSDLSKPTSAALDKTISGAKVGEWQIKISSQKANGILDMSVSQYTKPTIND
jgi:hypothetical protein